MTSIRTTFLTAGALLFAGTLAAFAHGGATGIVKERMDGMSIMADTVKAISQMFKSGDYDSELVRQGAKTISVHAGEALTKLFPEGTHGGPSEAKPEIWSQWERFQSQAETLKTYALALENAADRQPAGPGAAAPAAGMSTMMGTSSTMMGTATPSEEMMNQMPPNGVFQLVVNTCASCHESYRSEKKK